jgi:hypothetical protein
MFLMERTGRSGAGLVAALSAISATRLRAGRGKEPRSRSEQELCWEPVGDGHDLPVG